MRLLFFPKISRRAKRNNLARPKNEEEIANTYPLSIISKWEEFKQEDYARALINLPNIPPQIYIHIPFCSSRCAYCFYDINIGKSDKDQKKYIDFVKKEVELRKHQMQFHNVQAGSYYLGGGTPTKLNSDLLAGLIDYLHTNFPLQKNSTFTIETSPETCTNKKINLLLERKVNRISIGVQTLQDKLLKKLGRSHSSQESLNTIKVLLESNVPIFNIDLIYGLPEQSEKSFLNDLDILTNEGVPEFTLYHLRMNPLACLTFHKNDLHTQLSMFADAREFLIGKGYTQTRPLHFIKKEYIKRSKRYKAAPTSDQRSSSQKGYVLGFGSSAISQIGDYLYENKKGLSQYSSIIKTGNIPGRKQFKLSERDNQTRFIIQNLTQKGNIDIQNFEDRFGNLHGELKKKLTKLNGLGFVCHQENIFSLTDQSWICADMLERYFYPD